MFWLQPHSFRFLAGLILPIVFVGAFKGSVVPRILRNPVITTVGGMCYSIYLTHRTTVFALQAVLTHFHLHFWTWLAVSLLVVAPASIAVGAIYFRLIERPCMDPRWPQKLVARFRSGPRSRPPKGASPELETSPLLADNGSVGARFKRLQRPVPAAGVFRRPGYEDRRCKITRIGSGFEIHARPGALNLNVRLDRRPTRVQVSRTRLVK